MTPIKLILLSGCCVYVVDHAGNARLTALCPTPTDATWLGKSLSAHHQVPLEANVSLLVPTVTLHDLKD